MPQKPLKANKKIEKKKQPAANRHGKVPQQRKGKYDKPPKKGIELERYVENKELTRDINANNEANFAAVAESKGGRLKTLKGALPPALASKDKAARDKAAKLALKQQRKDDDAAYDAEKMEEEED
ncbi:hypothetical protein CEUSTIGMA_g6689.t1 [Chlamydomonas eustigma]|uniref:Uncharacterized protein n=1 Tax=Chlamydomonas eustigma TaxID=1157962 RepID=A0A250X8K4_9CHLO|nr:hypothetical protein CEUSTIGMA_g6689.t1 [Chlamydomonas eustigma]|eukprot:GAX79249.1 hypothetical protein CEUSTIGMA_g6689.t1 [Chlamydomonas eustigma]